MSIKYNRHSSVVNRQSEQPIDENNWLHRFEDNLLKEAVQTRKQDASLFDQINSIMNGKSKYHSVDAAVEDMKERSGLTAYLATINKISKDKDSVATKIASTKLENLISQCKDAHHNNDWYKFGNLIAKINKEEDGIKTNSIESIRTLKYFKDKEISAIKVPVDGWISYTSGYCDGFDFSKEEKEKDLLFTKNIIKKVLSSKNASDNQQVIDKKINLLPIVLTKHPQIKRTLENYIRDTKGNLPVPAIIEKLRSIHYNDVSDSKDWEDDKLIILVSKLNLSAKKNNPSTFQNYNNLGTRDSSSNSDIDPSNTDAFFALNPVRQ